MLTEVIERHARERPDDEAFTDCRSRVTWRQLHERVRVLAEGLMNLGLHPGDVLGLQLPNRVEAVELLLAGWTVGLVICPFPVTLRSREVEFILGFSSAKAVVIMDVFDGFSHAEMLRGIEAGLTELQHVIVLAQTNLNPGVSTWLSYSELVAEGMDLDVLSGDLTWRQTGPEDVCRLLFTSGSTGDPKGVLHTYNTTVPSNALQNTHMGISGESTILLFIPCMLNWGMFQVIQTILAGAKLVLMEKFEPVPVLTVIERERVTCFGSPPTALLALLRAPELALTKVESLTLVMTSGTSCPVEVLRETRERLGCEVMEGYGMTEVGWISATEAGDPVEEVVGSVGRPFPWMEVRVLGDTDVPPGDIGEIAVNGPFVCAGYYRNDARNHESWTEDGWFLTGDLGYIDSAGRLRLIGRSKEVIKHGGAQVWPRELEEILFTHPKIHEVAVVGVPDDYFGESTCACIIPSVGETITLDEVIRFLAPQVAKYKLPQYLVICDRFPYTATGKLQKHVLRQQALTEGSASIAGTSNKAEER